MHRSGCRHEEHPQIGRRELLQVGGTSLFGMGLADLLRLEAHAAAASATNRSGDTSPGRAKSLVFIFQSGGPSQHETFDPKPHAPAEIRGEYDSIGTRHSGIRFCEYLPQLATRSDRFTIVRTLHHVADRQFRNEHSSCNYLLQTGSVEIPAGDTNQSIQFVKNRPGRMEWPSIGSMIAYAKPVEPHVGLPAVIEIPRGSPDYPGRKPGMLGPQYSRWGVDIAPTCRAPDPGGSCPNCYSHDDPNDKRRAAGSGKLAWWDNSSCRNAEFHLPDLGSTSGGAAAGLTIPRLNRRTELLGHLEEMRRSFDRYVTTAATDAYDAHRRQAMQLLLTTRPGKQNPFDISHEPDRVRELYGREEWGNAFLVARRLVEAGVRMVQINLRGWDTHQNAFRDLKAKALPSLDHCLSGFLDDLADRGLLDETLIVMCGEMGRTPRVSAISNRGNNACGEPFTPGRHHWGDVFPCFIAGGGSRAGQIIGQTDRQGGVPVTEAFTPADLAATIFHLLGIGPDREFHDLTGRPYRIYRGQPIRALI